MNFDRIRQFLKKLPVNKITVGAYTIIIIILISYFVSNPNPDFNYEIVDFSLEEEDDTFRTGYPITFKWEIIGFVPQAVINWGDGNVETILNHFNQEKGTHFKIMNHSYLLQGKYFPKLQIWDHLGREYAKSCELVIQNDMLQFNISITPSYQVFEDEEVVISIENLFELNKGIREDIENLTYFYDFGDSQLTSEESSLKHKWKNEGMYPLTIGIIDSQGTISRNTTSIEVRNKSPEAYFPITIDMDRRARSKIKFSAENCIDTESDKNTLRYLWNWGDNTASWGKCSFHTYTLPGIYNITLLVIDDNGAMDSYSDMIVILNTPESGSTTIQSNTDDDYPYIAIGTLPTEVFEDEQVQFISEITLQKGNIADYTPLWSFGDDTCSFERVPLHSWTTAGIYEIELKVTDVNGNEYLRYETIAVKEKAPEILGPFSFQGVEGKAIDLDVEVYDALLDEPYLRYNWYNEKNQIFSTNKKPSVILDDGEYSYILEVSDRSGLTSTRVIKVSIHPISHEIFIPNYVYYSNDPGLIELRAYCYDNVFDTFELDFYWTISHGKMHHQPLEMNNGNYSVAIFECSETAVYQGQVRVYDQSGSSRVITFQIFSYVNTPKIEDNNEELYNFLGLKLAVPQGSSPDTDGDHLSDEYELQVSNTSIFNPDTDDDGLWDGYDDSGIGEKTLGTVPTNSDSDGDQLPDGLEYFGYEISICNFENTSTIHVNSDPLSFDTDLDTISDFDEFKAKTNPRLLDSDGDQLLDRNDPYPTTWDYDQDLLSDWMEKRLGTEINYSDTDQDGIKDGDEVNGWGILHFQTNPIYPDTDEDFTIDSAELKNYKVSLEDEYGKEIRVNLTESVSLHFPQFFTKAATAQISFALSFGEQGSDDTQTYGIDNSSVMNLDISIIKASDDIVLYKSKTNGTRHFSQVVDITDIMNDEQLGLNYYGEYIIEVTDVNGNSIPGCLLEQFELDFTRYLDPNNADFDGDGIFDGVEMDLLVRGTDVIDIRDFYDCSNEGKKYQNEEINEFLLEIPEKGRVYEAKITMHIESENPLMGKGNVSIKLVKRISQWVPELLTYQENFDINDNFLFTRTVDLSSFFKFGYLGVYTGEYVLKVEIQDTNPNDTFYISEFYIETDTYVQAGHQDDRAWLTDPALSDSDSDGWSDSYEIFTSSTNPLNKDTDGDNAWDPNDRDPLRNVMLEIQPISGTFYNPASPLSKPNLQMVIKLHVNDLIDPEFSEDRNKIVFFTNSQASITNPTDRALKTAWWNEGDGTHYYLDISDDVTVQSNMVPFYFQLWEMLIDGMDVPVFAGGFPGDIYSINEVGNWEELTIQVGYSGIRCQVETIAIERANTIAIFESNSTIFTGHYNSDERMNMIQLHVTADGYYPATISFEHEDDGTTSDEWDDGEMWIDHSYADQNPTIINELDGHHKVLQFHDSSSIGRGRITHDWNQEIRSGTVELWIRLSAFSRASILIRDENDNNGIYFRFDSNGYFQHKKDSTFYNIDQYSINQWIHLKFTWDFWEDWHLWVNGKSYDTIDDPIKRTRKGFEYLETPYAMDSLVIHTDGPASNYYVYVDSIGYSFDPEYVIGDNLYRSTSQGTPFIPGPNIIIIPTSLFEKTVLNGYIQNEELGKTPLYTTKEGCFEFYSIDRDGNIVDDQCADTDSVFIRYDITPTEAMQILNSLLLCAVNQSLDEYNNTITELAKIYEYISTKLDGISAVTLNLPKGLMASIPWFSEFVNSPFGRTPKQLNLIGILVLGLLFFAFPIAGLFLSIIFIAGIFSTLFDRIAAEIGLTFLTFLGKLLWILIRAALIIVSYILLGLELLTTSLIFVSIGLILSSLNTLICKWGLDFAIPYSENKTIAFINFTMSEYTISIEAYIEWIYWEFFDIYFPLLKMNTDQASMLDKISEMTSITASPPELACGWDHVEDLKYDFHVEYRQRPEGYPPNYVKLILINPQSKEEYECFMEETPGQQFNDYYNFVRFNYTVDFKDFDVEERQGQWYYCFMSEASVINTTCRWPYTGYAIGPLINDLRHYFISSYLEPISGMINDDFMFSVMGGDFIDNFEPTSVRLNILWPNETIQSFIMEKTSTFALNETDLNTYDTTLNFLNYLIIDRRVELKYNFEAVFQDGKVAVLWDYETLDENSNVDDDLINYTYEKCWFEGPILYPLYSSEYDSPIIRDWYIEDLTWNRIMSRESTERVLNPVSDEFILRFYIYVEDPDGTHEDHYRNGFEIIPKLHLTNLNNPENPVEPIDMRWTGGNYGPGSGEYDEYFVDIIGSGYYAYKYENRSDLIKCNFGAGAWNFSFQVTDNQSHTVHENSNKKIWHIGSIDNMVNTLFYGHPTGSGIGGLFGSIMTTITYISMAVLASCKTPVLQIAAQVIAAGLLIVDLSMNIYSLIKFTFETEDTGAVLGLGFNLLLKSCGFIISLALSKNDVGRINFKFLSSFASIATALTLLNLWNQFTSSSMEVDENGDLTLTQDETNPSFDTFLGGYPSMIISFLTSIIGLTTSLFITSGYAKFGGGGDGVSKVIVFHTILSFVMSILSIIMFLEKSGYFHVANDLNYTNVVFGG